MPWADVLNVFDGIYISWDPALWATPKVFHGYGLAIFYLLRGLNKYVAECGSEVTMRTPIVRLLSHPCFDVQIISDSEHPHHAIGLYEPEPNN